MGPPADHTSKGSLIKQSKQVGSMLRMVCRAAFPLASIPFPAKQSSFTACAHLPEGPAASADRVRQAPANKRLPAAMSEGGSPPERVRDPEERRGNDDRGAEKHHDGSKDRREGKSRRRSRSRSRERKSSRRDRSRSRERRRR